MTQARSVKYSRANAKLAKLASALGLPDDKRVYSFDLLSGHTCPFAEKCKSKVVETADGLRVQDGPKCEFRCFSASNEATYSNTYYMRKRNTEALKATRGVKNIVGLLEATLPKDCGVLRMHVGGDFFRYEYFQAVCELARRHPDMVIYAYTKAVPYVEKYGVENIPSNFRVTLSRGGKCDDRIADVGLPVAHVAFSPDEAASKGLEVDHNDSHAASPIRKDFAILLHGMQPKNTPAADAVNKMRREGVEFSYTRA